MVLTLPLFLMSLLCADIKDPNDELLLSKVPILMQKYQVPGVALGLVRHGKISCIECFGFANKDSLSKVNPDSIFQVASIAKTITAWEVMLLFQQGKLDLDAPVEQYLQTWKIPDSPYRKEDVTIRRILNHTAGLSISSYGYGATSTDLIESLNGVSGTHEPLRLCNPPGEFFNYTGGGYTLLQLLIEDVTSMKFSDYMVQELLSPLKLSHSSFSFPESHRDQICTPYDILGRSPLPMNFTEQAAAGFFTTIRDLASFITYTLTSPLLLQMIKMNKDGYGLGYEVELLKPDMLLAYHLGANPGWRAGFFILPSLNGGLVILTNSDQGSDLIQDIANEWVENETGSTAEFYQETLNDRYIMQLVNFLTFSIFGCCLFRWIFKLVQKERHIKIIWRRIIPQAMAWIGLIVLWRILFYNEIPIGGGVWIISAFMPPGFDLLLTIVYTSAALGILASLTVHAE